MRRYSAAWWLIALVFGATAFVSSAQPSPDPVPDLAVVDFRVVGPEAPKWVDGEPTHTVVETTILNRGSGTNVQGYRIDYQWIRDGQVLWLNGNDAESIDFHPTTDGDAALGPGDSRQHELPWRLQPGQAGDVVVRVTVTSFGTDAQSGNNRLQAVVLVPVRQIVLSVPSYNQDAPMRADQTRFVRVLVENQGTVDERAWVNLTGVDTPGADRLRVEWYPADVGVEGLAVPAGSSATATLFVHYPWAGDRSTFSVRYGVEVDTGYDTTLANQTARFVSLDEDMVDGSPATLQRVGEGPLVADSGAAVEVAFRVANEPAGTRDTYTAAVAVADAGWGATISPDHVGLEPGETQTLSVVVTFPAAGTVPLGSSSTLYVMFQSDRDEVLAKTPETHNVTLRLSGPAVRLEAGAGWPDQPYAGDPQRYPVRLVNHGDAPTPNSTITLLVTGHGGTGGEWSLGVPPVAAGRSTIVAFDLGAFPDESGPIQVAADWAPDQETAAPVATLGFVADLWLDAPDVAVQAPDPLRGVPGETVEYRAGAHTFVVTNHGDVSKTLVLALTTDAGSVDLALDEPRITLAPGQHRSVPFDHGLPLPAGAATESFVELTAKIAERDDWAWSANVTTILEDSQPPQVALDGGWPSVWAVGERLTVRVEAVDDSAVDGVNVTQTTPSGDVTQRSLAPDGQDHWTAALPINGAGNHKFVVLARDVHGNEAVLALAPVAGATVPPPVVNASANASEVRPSDVIEVWVHDERPVTAMVRAAWAENGSLALQKAVAVDADGRAAFNLTGLGVGAYNVTVEATNDAGSRANTTWQVVVMPPDDASEAGPEEDTGLAEGATAPGLGVLGLLALVALALPIAGRRRRTPRQRDRGETSTGQALALTLILVAASVLAAAASGIAPVGSPHAADGADGTDDAPAGPMAASAAAAEMARLWAGLPDALDPATAMGPAAQYLFEPGDGGLWLRDAPTDAADLMGRVLGPDAERLSVPDPPEGPEPLLSAIRSLEGSPGLRLPDANVLRAQIASLRLMPEAEQGLSQLVLAYGDAVRLEEAALSGLSPEERRLLADDADAWAEWYSEDPGRSESDGDAWRRELAARVDMTDLLQATDLLVRTAQAVKDVVGLPPAPLDASGGNGSDGARPASGAETTWGLLDQLVLSTDLARARDLPALPEQELRTALQSLATTLGVPAEAVQEMTVPAGLPPSLADAVAGIVTARWVGLSSGDPHVHTRLLLRATQHAEPTLRAWGAVLSMADADVPLRDVRGLFDAVVTPGVQPSALISHGVGAAAVAPAAPLPLADVLARQGMPASDASAAAAGLPADVAAALAVMLDGTTGLEEALLEHGETAQSARDARVDVAALLAKPSWTHDEAARVHAWAEGPHPAGVAAERAIQDAQAVALASVEAAVALLEPRAAGDIPTVPAAVPGAPYHVEAAAEKPWYRHLLDFFGSIQIIGTASAQGLPPLPGGTCPSSPVSDCDADVWFYVEQGGGVLVTGPGRTTIGNFGTGSFPYSSAPRFVVDLGGDDTYEVPAGAALSVAPAGVVIDVGGDDHYVTESGLAHGAARGQGTLGVLWDLSGDDHYEHLGDPASSDNVGQGYGEAGGVGMLIDGAGEDRFAAERSMAHGVAWMPGDLTYGGLPPSLSVGDLPGYVLSLVLANPPTVGALLDRGHGNDTFVARTGQGHAATHLGLALLLNEEGVAAYETRLSNTRFQGGAHERAVGAVGMLVDLGGAGTSYSSDELPDGTTYFPDTRVDKRRQDDAVWVMESNRIETGSTTARSSVGLGIDSTLADENENLVPDVVELVGGGMIQTVLDLVENPPDPGEAAENLFPFSLEAVGDRQLYRPHESRGCALEEDDEPEPFALLYIDDSGNNTIEGVAHLLIDLGGNDTYTNEVAGPGRFCTGTEVAIGFPGSNPLLRQDAGAFLAGSFALDLDGDDAYSTPGLSYTQGAIDPAPYLSASLIPHQVPQVSLLLELGGDDRYDAVSSSQGAANGGNLEFLSIPASGAAWLMDVQGDDVYTSIEDSQGFAVPSGGVGALVDLDGNDAYTFNTQGTWAFRGGRMFTTAKALFYDGGGKDRYISNTPLDEGLFRDQGYSDARTAGILAGGSDISSLPFPGVAIGLFIDEGPHDDQYLRLDTSDFPPVYTDVSSAKNNHETISSNTESDPPARRLPTGGFSDGLTRAVDTRNLTLDDDDGDGSSNLLETLAGTDPADETDHPGTFWQDPTRLQNLDGAELWLDFRGASQAAGRGGFAVGGHATNAYRHGPYDFLVDLGGSDTYSYAGAGSGMLLMDAGDDAEDDDRYLPTTDAPSLGAPAGPGLAVLLDNGGTNVFASQSNVTQGAATAGGVGALISWDASNQFDANATVAAQGAGRSAGTGVLASFGFGTDSYHVVGVGATAQGAGMDGGTGLLVDGGGTNRFVAADAVNAQGSGSGSGSFGLLWAGHGSDRYRAGDVSQAAAASNGVGALVEPGGDDTYEGGMGSQGASGGAVAFLADLGGHDRYHAIDQSQGYGASGLALLVDMHGQDVYTLQGTEGQGWGCTSALLLDLGHDDEYNVGHDDGSQWSSPSGCARPTGLDSEDLAAVWDALAPDDDDPPELEFRAHGTPFDAPKTTNDAAEVVLRAKVAEPNRPDEVRRVTFFIDDEAAGQGVYVGTQADRLHYEYILPIAADSLPDGRYTVYAHVVAEPVSRDDVPVGAPDTPGASTAEETLAVDSVPRVDAVLDGQYVSPNATREVLLNVTLGRDLDWPQENGQPIAPDALCPDDGSGIPGGFVRVHATDTENASVVHTILDGYCPAGTHGLRIDLAALTEPTWDDGTYALTVEVVDAVGRQTLVANPNWAVVVDADPPTSWIPLPYVNSAHRNQTDPTNVRIPWESSGESGASGVARVFLVQLTHQGLIYRTFGPLAPSGEVEVPAVHNETLTFVTVAEDSAGNSESPCLTGETPTEFVPGVTSCFERKSSQNVTTDFVPPRFVDDNISARYIRPGDPVTFFVNVTDDDSGIQEVRVQVPDGLGSIQEIDAVPHGAMEYRTTLNHSGVFAGGEVLYSYDVVAHDAAGNVGSIARQGVIDSTAPRVSHLGTEYVKVGLNQEETLGAGDADTLVRIALDVRDVDFPRFPSTDSLAAVTVDAAVLNASESPVPVQCLANDATLMENDWLCEVELGADVLDGVFHLPITAVDAAGNANETQTAEVVVSKRNLPVDDLEILDVTHDGFTVRWATDIEGTSIVQYSRVKWNPESDPQSFVQAPGDVRTGHTVHVTGLSPSSTYYLRAVSESVSGVRANSSILDVRTTNAYEFKLVDFPEDEVVAGTLPVRYNLTFLAGTNPVELRFRIQDAGKVASPLEIQDPFPQEEGNATLPVDTTRFADGTYQLLVTTDRLGDRAQFRTGNFTIDNTHPIVVLERPLPESSTGSPRPEIEALVLDPGGTAPGADAVRLHADGVPVNVAVVSDEPEGADGRRVVVTPDADLEHGNHVLNVSVADAAGNPGWALVDLLVDRRPPTLDAAAGVRPLPGPEMARPGGQLRVNATLVDDSPVTDVWLDTTPLGGSNHSLLSLGAGLWEATFDVPANAPEGIHGLSLHAVDAHGNEAHVGLVEVELDATPPTATRISVEDVGYVDAVLRVATDEVTRAQAQDGAWSEWGTTHALPVDGLRPGQEYDVPVMMRDRAGHENASTMNFETRDDTVPPDPVANLTATSPVDGVVLLTWEPATDNAGVDEYVVQRSAAPRAEPLETVTTDVYLDDRSAPAGRSVTYRIIPIDVASNEGPPMEVTLRVRATATLRNASVSPLEGPAHEPFVFQVEFHHPGGVPADRVRVQVAGAYHALSLDSSDECHVGCRYRADVMLPPTSQVAPSTPARFVATYEEHQATLVAPDVPLVLSDHVDRQTAEDPPGTPAPGILPILGILFAITVASRQFSSRRPRP